MTTEALRRPGLPAVALLVVLWIVAFVVPSLASSPESIGVVDVPNVLGVAYDPLADQPFDTVLDRGGSLPVTQFSYVVDTWLGGGAATPRGMRWHSALAHLLTALVLLFLLARLGAPPFGAGFGALVFLLHPAVLDTVSLVGFRAAILGGLFSFLALAAVARGASTRRWGHWVLAVACAVLAAGASPVALVLPVLAYLVGWRVAGRGIVSALALAIPIAAVSAIYVGFAGWSPGAWGNAAVASLVGLVLPSSPAFLAAPAWAPAVATGVAAAAGLVLAGVAFALRRRFPTVAVGLGVIVVAVGAAVTQSGEGFLPDAAGYLAVAGLATVLAAVRMPERARIPIAAALVLGLLVVDLQRVGSYRSASELFVAADSPLANALHAEHLAQVPDAKILTEAAERFAASLPTLPESAPRRRLHEGYVRTLARLGRLHEASDAATQLCTVAEASGDTDSRVAAYLMAAECFSRQGRDEKVDEYFDRAKAIAPSNPDVIAAFGERDLKALAESLGVDAATVEKAKWLPREDARAVAIEKAADQALAADAKCLRAHLLKGRLCEARGDVLDAWNHYNDAHELQPRHVDPVLLLAGLDLRIEGVDEAFTVVSKALNGGANDPRLHYLLVMIHSHRGDAPRARQYLETYMKNYPGDSQGRVLLASILSAEAMRDENEMAPKELEHLAKRIAELNPDDPKGLLIRATVLLRKKPPTQEDYRGAIVLLENARLAMPKDPEAHRRLAIAHKRYGWFLKLSARKPELAMDQFKTFLDMAPKSVPTDAVQRAYQSHCQKLLTRGLGYLEKGDAKRAEPELLRLTKLLPSRSESYFQLGLARLDLNKLDAALANFEAAIDLGRKAKVDVGVYYLTVVDTLTRLGRDHEAKRRGEEFLKTASTSDPRIVEKIRARLQR